MQTLQHALRWGNVFLVLFTLLVYLVPFVNPVSKWPVAVLGLFYPILLTSHILFILLWSVWRKWYFALSLGCVLVGWGHVQAIVGFSLKSTTDIEHSNTLKIMTFNSHSFSSNTEDKKWVEKDQVLKLLHDYQPDILCVQEFAENRRELRTFREWIHSDNNYPYELTQVTPSLAIFSRYPLEDGQFEKFENSLNGYQQTTVQLNGEKIRLINLHLQTNAITKMAARVTSPRNLKSKKTWRQMGGMLKRYQRAARMRVVQTQKVLESVEKSTHPVIICGDLNDVPQSYIYRLLKGDHNDTFKKAGHGLGMTYAGEIPGLRIDYIFTPPEYAVLNTQVLRPGFSDHRPVLSTILLKNGE